MRIAQIAPPFERVPPSRYGGTERVVSNLTEALVRMGHEVTLFAAANAETSARLVPVVDKPVWHDGMVYGDYAPFLTLTMGKVAAHAERFDLIHSHADHYGFPLARALRTPVLTTMHGRLDLPELRPLFQEFVDIPLVSISDAQRAAFPHGPWIATIHHGIEVERFPFSGEPGGYLAFLGRISPDKGVDAAIRIARRAGMPLLIAAREPLKQLSDAAVRADWDYYQNAVKPLLKEPGIEFIGEVDEAGKGPFLAGAAALLFPIDWPEPFGLVMIESLACGTPVIARRRGSVPEVVEDRVTGFVGDSEDDLFHGVERLNTLDRGRCRAEAERRFSAVTMAKAYLDVYAELVGEPLGHVETMAPSWSYRNGKSPLSPGLLPGVRKRIITRDDTHEAATAG